MSTPLRYLLFSLAASTSLTAYGQVSLDFETAGQVSDNFRNIGTTVTSNTQSSNAGANDYLIHNVTDGAGSEAVLLYDTTPGDTTLGTQSTFSVGSSLNVSFDFRASTAGSSIGIIFADPTNAANYVLALFSVDNGGITTSDLLRFFKDGTSAGNQSGSTTTASSGINAGSSFGHFSATLSVVGTTPTISLTVGSQTASRTFPAGDYDWTNTTVALRLYDAGAGNPNTDVWVDNFTIGAIPEPSTYAVVSGAAVLGLALWRRRPKA
ncbi:MAG TPA: PEP-CTERM sorting domain-containing protein [Rariglobus sp.]|nr:PEP-CTERM sorting domain-containing protein [Rariglobus sp.]